MTPADIAEEAFESSSLESARHHVQSAISEGLMHPDRNHEGDAAGRRQVMQLVQSS